jgi:hypothetical protein
MDKVIRHEDGSQINTQEWNAIKASTRMSKHELRQLPPPSDQRAQNQAQTKVYYKQYYPKEWTRITLQLEDDQPLLKLCSSHWKAEHVMNNCLMNDRNKNSNHEEDSDNSHFDAAKKKTITQQTRNASRASRTETQNLKDMDDIDQGIRSKACSKYPIYFCHIVD